MVTKMPEQRQSMHEKMLMRALVSNSQEIFVKAQAGAKTKMMLTTASGKEQIGIVRIRQYAKRLTPYLVQINKCWPDVEAVAEVMKKLRPLIYDQPNSFAMPLLQGCGRVIEPQYNVSSIGLVPIDWSPMLAGLGLMARVYKVKERNSRIGVEPGQKDPTHKLIERHIGYTTIWPGMLTLEKWAEKNKRFKKFKDAYVTKRAKRIIKAQWLSMIMNTEEQTYRYRPIVIYELGTRNSCKFFSSNEIDKELQEAKETNQWKL